MARKEPSQLRELIQEKTTTRVSAGVLLAFGGMLFIAAAIVAFQGYQTSSSGPRMTALKKDAPAYIGGRVLVKFADNLSDADRAATIKKSLPASQIVITETATGKIVNQLDDTVAKDIKNNPTRYRRTTVRPTLKATRHLFASENRSAGAASSPTPDEWTDTLNRWQVVTLQQSNADIPATIQSLKKNPAIAQAEPDYLFYTSLASLPDDIIGGGGGVGPANIAPNDKYYSSKTLWPTKDDQWGPKRIGLGQGWNTTKGSSSVVVAVVDSGVDASHPDLQGRFWDDGTGHIGYDFNSCNQWVVDPFFGFTVCNINKSIDNIPDDENGHGTHVTGIIGAATNNTIGMAGVDWNAKLMEVRIINKYGQGIMSEAVQGIQYALDHGANVINMSWGGPSGSSALADVLQAGQNSIPPVLEVAAAGNDNKDATVNFPGSYPGVMNVGAWTSGETRADFSNWGSRVDIMAPGADIVSLRAANTDMYGTAAHIVPTCYNPGDGSPTSSWCPGNQYYTSDGTSMASPAVAGTLSLLKAVQFAVRPAGVVPNRFFSFILKATSRTVEQAAASDSGPSTHTYQVLNAQSALHSAADWFVLDKAELTLNTVSITPVDQKHIEIKGDISSEGLVDVTTPFKYTVYACGFTCNPLAYEKTIPSLAQTGHHSINDLLDITPYPDVKNIMIKVDMYNAVPEYLKTNQAATVPINTSVFPGNWPVTTNGNITAPIAIGDVDGDGNVDIVTAGEVQSLVDGSVTNQVVLAYHKNGSPLPGFPVSVTTPGAGTHPALFTAPVITDVNGDGNPDIVIGGNDGYVYAWRGNGTPLGAPWPKLTTAGQQVYAPVVVDLDKNGSNDLVVSAGTMVYAWDKNGANLPGWPKTLTAPGTAVNLAVGNSLSVDDLNNDGQNEVIVGSYGNYQGPTNIPGYIFGWHADGTAINTGDVCGAPAWPINPAKFIDPNHPCGSGGYVSLNFIYPPIIADVNGDGQKEMFFNNTDSFFFSLKYDGTAFWSGQPDYFPMTYGFSPAAADFNGDGKLEVANMELNGRIHIWDNNHQELPGWPQQVPNLSGYTLTSYPEFADIDGDDKPELILQSNNYFYAWKANGTFASGFPIQLDHSPSYTPTFPEPSHAVYDLDRDGRAELIYGLRGLKLDGEDIVYQPSLYVQSLATKSVGEFPMWPSERHDNQRTGIYTQAVQNLPPDTLAPSVPGTPTGNAPDYKTVNLAWAGSTDTGGSDLAGYFIYRCASASCSPTDPVGTSASPSFTDSTVSPNTAYTYAIKAHDYAGNISATSGSFQVTTPSMPLPPDVTKPVFTDFTLSPAPVNGTVTRGATYTISASLTDNVGVTRVKFIINGGTPTCDLMFSSITPVTKTCSWKVPNQHNASYSLKATAYDAAANAQDSNTINVTVP